MILFINIDPDRQNIDQIIVGIEVSRTPKGYPEQLAIVLTYLCKLFLIYFA